MDGSASPGRLKKLGIKPGSRVVRLRIDDPELRSELSAVGAKVVSEPRIPDADLIVLRVEDPADLRRLPGLRQIAKPDVAVWTLRRKGRKDLTAAQVMAAGLAAGFVDVKVVNFSETLTTVKFVVRLRDRGRRLPALH